MSDEPNVLRNLPAAPMPAQTLTGKFLTAIGRPPEKKYRVLVHLGDGEHKVVLMNSQEALNYLNGGNPWHRIA